MAQRRHGVDLAHRRCAGLPNGLISFGLSARPNNHVQHSLGRYSSRRSHHVPVAPVYRYGGSHRCARHCSQCNHLHSRERGHDPIAALRRAQPDHAGGGEERQTQPADVRGFRADLPFLARADAIVRATRRSGLRHLYPEWKWGARATHGKPHQPRPAPGSRHQAHRRARVQSGRREARWRGSRHYWRRPMEAPFCLGPSPRRPNDFPGWIAHDDRRDRSGRRRRPALVQCARERNRLLRTSGLSDLGRAMGHPRPRSARVDVATDRTGKGVMAVSSDVRDPEVVDLLQQMVRNGCVNDGTEASGQEIANAELLRAGVEGSGCDLEIYEPLPGRTSWAARIEGSDAGAPALCYLGHTDVVPANPDTWSRDPFGGELVDGEVWGRGAVDMLNITASMAVAFGRLARSGFRPRGTLILAAVADEEALGSHGAGWLSEHAASSVGADYVITESGGVPIETPGGRRLAITVGEKGSCWCRLRVRGTAGHASAPLRTDNALVTAAAVVGRLASFRPAASVHDAWRRFVAGMSLPGDIGAMRSE